MSEPGARSSRLTTLLLLLGVAIAIAAFDELRSDSAPEATGQRALATGPLRTEPPLRRSRPQPAPEPIAEPAPAVERTPDVEPLGAPEPAPRLAASPPPPEPSTRPAIASYDWYEGASGLSSALKESETEGRALAVYFYTSWCGYCRQLEREILDRAEVEGYMKYMTKVRINPERGRTERAIANHYSVRGYPSFFVHGGVGKAPKKISGMTRENGEWRVKTPDEFVEALRRAIGDV